MAIDLLLVSAQVFVVRRRLSFQTTNAFRVHEQNGDTRVGFANGTASSPTGAFWPGRGEGWEAESFLRIGPLPRTRAWLKVWLVS